MNVLGVDPQPSGVVVALREGTPPAWPPADVGEAANAAAVARRAALLVDPRADHAAAPDWTRLAERVGAFTGAAPGALGLRRTIVAQVASAPAFSPAPDSFGAVSTVCAGRAALIAALGDQMGRGRLAARAVVVVAGDVQVGVFGFQLDVVAAGVRVVRATVPVTIADSGAAFWAAETASALAAVSPELDVTQAAAGIWTGAAELGARLALAAHDDDSLAWNGPIRDQMAAPPDFSRRAAARWVSVERLASALPGAVSQVIRQLGGDGALELFVAGAGAAWPFAARLVAGAGAVTAVNAPGLAAARGAAWWPLIGETLFKDCQDIEAPPASRPAAHLTPPHAAPVPGGADLEVLSRLTGGASGDSQ